MTPPAKLRRKIGFDEGRKDNNSSKTEPKEGENKNVQPT